MPVLYAYKTRPGSYAKASIQGAVVTFQITEAGRLALAEAGVKAGEKFPQAILLDLIRRGEAFTGGSGVDAPSDDPAQMLIDWGMEEDLDSHLPKCEETGSAIDLHLVVVEENGQPRARLLGPDPRHILRKVTTLSIPLVALTLDLLDRLETVEKLPKDNPAVATVRDWLRQDRAKEWERLRQIQSQRQADLGLDTDGGDSLL